MQKQPTRDAAGRIRLALCLSDLHAGSSVGLLPDGFTTLEGQGIKHNPAQAWVWKCWRDLHDSWLPSIVGADPYALAVVGDLTEGIHHGGRQVVSTDMADHVSAADELLRPVIAKAAKTFFVEGTEVHTGSTEAKLAKSLGAVPDPGNGKAVWERLTLTVAGCRCVFFHHISATSREYLGGSALSIYLGNEQLAAAKNGEPIPRVVGCAHRHKFDKYEDATGAIFVLPPWQMLTRHGNKVVPSARTRPGAVVLDWRGLPDGSLPRLHVRTYRLPGAEGITL